MSNFKAGILTGAIGATLFILVVFIIFPALWNGNVYDVSHWKLNIRTPMHPMWMNLGFWRPPRDNKIVSFDEACSALLSELVVTSGILGQDLVTERKTRPNRSIAILDVGFGCGDQTWELAKALEAQTWNEYRYVGLTLDPAQFDIARQRKEQEIAAANRSGLNLLPGSFRLFKADAAQPELWECSIQDRVGVLGGSQFTDKWVVALDCLYHFSPSRVPIFKYSAKTFGANLMAFDLLLDNKATWFGILAGRILSVLSGSPFRAFITEQEYISQLVTSGYNREGIQIRDITYDVFPGLVAYLDRQQLALAPYGISLGKYKMAKRVFKWFSDSGTVRATIIVAKLKEKNN